MPTPYTVIFECDCPKVDINKRFKITYTGPDVSPSFPCTDTQSKKLKEYLNEDFGFGPFKESKLDQILGDRKEYEL